MESRHFGLRRSFAALAETNEMDPETQPKRRGLSAVQRASQAGWLACGQPQIAPLRTVCLSVVTQRLQILDWRIADDLASRADNEARPGLAMTFGYSRAHVIRSTVA